MDIIAQNPRFFLMPTVFTIAVRVSDTASILRGGICVYMKTTAEFERTNNIDLSIIGMRKDESKNRRFVLNKRGAIYRTQNRESITCCPLMNFSDEDIWAYIFNNNLKKNGAIAIVDSMFYNSARWRCCNVIQT